MELRWNKHLIFHDIIIDSFHTDSKQRNNRHFDFDPKIIQPKAIEHINKPCLHFERYLHCI